MDQYLPILLLVVLALLFAIGSFVASRVLGPNGHLNPAKVGPYESGIAPVREPSARFPVRFYLIAMIFIIFDIEIVFLYPWAVIFHQLNSFGLVEVLVFAAVVFISFLFLVSNGALTWGPAKRLERAMPSRTSSSTIARIAAGPGGPGGRPDPSGPGRTTDPVPPATGDPVSVPGPGQAA